MRYRTLEIRWHDSKPISSCDFQPVGFKKARPHLGTSASQATPTLAAGPTQEREKDRDRDAELRTAYASQAYRLATAGEDNHVRIWMVHPNLCATAASTSPTSDGRNAMGDGEGEKERAPRIEYLATLSRHSAAVNVVRFSPNGDLLASAGDDGMIIVWAPSASPPASAFSSSASSSSSTAFSNPEFSTEDLQHEKEWWKPRTTFRCSTMQVYDLAWSPTGDYLLAGSTDNVARVFAAADGKCVCEIAEHSHYVQGVAWDPMNEYIATQSSDRSMHVYKISTAKGTFEAHSIGRNTRFPVAPVRGRTHSRTPSMQESAPLPRSQSIDSERESVVLPPTPASLHASNSFPDKASSSMFPPSTSRRSSFSGSNAPSSPSISVSRYGRSPSPMPALPAIRTPPSVGRGRYDEASRERSAVRGDGWAADDWAAEKDTRYDARRMTDGARMYGDEGYSNFFRRLAFSPDGGLLLTPAGTFEDPGFLADERGRKQTHAAPEAGANSTVYIYTRANFARPPVAQLPGHRKASVAVRFNPILFDLRMDVGSTREAKLGTGTATGEAHDRQSECKMDVDILPSSAPEATPTDLRPPTPAASRASTPGPSAGSIKPGAVFALPYRMLYAVVTMDTVAIYDTQQTGPVCLLSKLHYDELTDLTWSPDGQCLMLSSRDGYCTMITFDEILPAHHTQQSSLQLQQIAAQHSVPILSSIGTPSTRKRPLELPILAEESPSVAAMTPSTSMASLVSDRETDTEDAPQGDAPPKKKRRVALTRVGDL
ncbi:unnamed protein product [Mycena citricolor]|uniref:CAF1B/HIR1 beta-propeller domain-containing protein n=1 Tax=Mycena citricolor TaxID=2018698 RepID=A0AAD2H312_9AGAR|nr:unnamed protein product [Mycena citricolor]